MRAVLAALIAVGVTGCGGNARLTRSEFVAALNRICVQELTAMQTKLSQPPTSIALLSREHPPRTAVVDMGRWLRTSRRVTDPFTRRIEALRAPKDDALVTEVTAGIERASRLEHDQERAFLAGDWQRAKRLSLKPADVPKKALRALGAEACLSTFNPY
jgi:hypothetical protein